MSVMKLKLLLTPSSFPLLLPAAEDLVCLCIFSIPYPKMRILSLLCLKDIGS